MGLRSLKIVEEEIAKVMPRLRDGPIQVDGRTLANILTTLQARLSTRIEAECIEVDEDTAEALDRLADPAQEWVTHDQVEAHIGRPNCGCADHRDPLHPCPHD